MPTPEAAIASFRRRLTALGFVMGALRATLVIAVLAAAALVGARLFDGYLPMNWWWAALVVPVVAFGWYRASRERPDLPTAAAHLDRRLELGGLLLSAHQVAGGVGAGAERAELDPAWRAHLQHAMAGLPAALPRLRWGRLLPGPVLAAAVFTLTAMLPPPALAPAATPVADVPGRGRASRRRAARSVRSWSRARRGRTRAARDAGGSREAGRRG